MPKQRTFALVFVSLIGAGALAHAQPLRDRGGAPACGNIGQVGRPTAHQEPRPARATLATRTARIARTARTARMARALMRSVPTEASSTAARPRTAANGDVACGNTLSKGGVTGCRKK